MRKLGCIGKQHQQWRSPLPCAIGILGATLAVSAAARHLLLHRMLHVGRPGLAMRGGICQYIACTRQYICLDVCPAGPLDIVDGRATARIVPVLPHVETGAVQTDHAVRQLACPRSRQNDLPGRCGTGRSGPVFGGRGCFAAKRQDIETRTREFRWRNVLHEFALNNSQRADFVHEMSAFCRH